MSTLTSGLPCTGWNVYRLYDAAGQLLYVGYARALQQRICQHLRKPWGSQIARVEYEDLGSEEEARAEEDRIYRAERPLHNKKYPLGNAERRREANRKRSLDRYYKYKSPRSPSPNQASLFLPPGFAPRIAGTMA